MKNIEKSCLKEVIFEWSFVSLLDIKTVKYKIDMITDYTAVRLNSLLESENWQKKK